MGVGGMNCMRGVLAGCLLWGGRASGELGESGWCVLLILQWADER